MSERSHFDGKVSQLVESSQRSPQMAARRGLVLEMLALRPGCRVLDIGTGPGFLADEMARAVGPGGRVVGIDNSTEMLALAKQRCAGHAHVEFLEGDALKLPFEIPSFDAAVASQVYEFVEDLPRALRELRRVLVPGGTAAILDTDWSSLVWEARDRERAERIFEAWEDHLADPHLPRRLAPALREARFEVAEVRPYTLFSLAHDAFTASLATRMARMVPGRLGLKEEDASAWAAELVRLSEEGGYFFSLTGYLFRVVKPSLE
jgi:ubiquinone/menaquinone biosynthesis C-methylase UbiE